MSSHTNDPRQPSAARPYVAPQIAPQDLPIDYAGFIAVIFGVAGVMFRVCIWSTSSPSISLLNFRFDALTLFFLFFYLWNQYKLSSWLALIFCAQSVANMRNVENDLKQVMMAMMWVSSFSSVRFLFAFSLWDLVVDLIAGAVVLNRSVAKGWINVHRFGR